MAAFLILACIAAYGYLIKRFKNKSIKQVHFMLTMAWLVTLLIHGGGLVILSCGALLGLFIVLSLLKSEQKEKATKQRRTSVI
jgi:D-alanyl-lipoteichoic acid acyltransferase DltB (MBOAT superfamily)